MSPIPCICGSPASARGFLVGCERNCGLARPVTTEFMGVEKAIEVWNRQAQRMIQPLMEGDIVSWMPSGSLNEWTCTVLRDHSDGWITVNTGPNVTVVMKKELERVEA